jgi:hypothetical protein
MESYLVRIYRRELSNPEIITGTVGKIGTEEILTFKNLAELREIIIGRTRQEDEEKSNTQNKD